jgi:hypothetical protein
MQARTLNDGTAEAITNTFSVGKRNLQPCPAAHLVGNTNKRTAK